MSKLNIKKAIVSFTVFFVAFAFAGCGQTGTNNDQGTSVTSLGYFADPQGTVGFSALVYDLNLGGYNLNLADGSTAQGVFMGVQNNLASQFFRVTQLNCSFDIPGTSIATFQDSQFTTSLIPAAGVNNAAGAGGAGVGAGGATTPVVGPISYVGLDSSTDLGAFLNSLANSLPAAPFRMIQTCRAIGVTQAGDVIESNDSSITVTVTEGS